MLVRWDLTGQGKRRRSIQNAFASQRSPEKKDQSISPRSIRKILPCNQQMNPLEQVKS